MNELWRQGRVIRAVDGILPACLLIVITWAGVNASPAWGETGIAFNGSSLRAWVLVAAGAAGFLLAVTRLPDVKRSLVSPVGLLFAYGGVGLVAGFIDSPQAAVATYWAVAYLAVIAVVLSVLAVRDDRIAGRHALHLTLFIIGALAVLAVSLALIQIGSISNILSGNLGRVWKPYDHQAFAALVQNANGGARFAALLATIAFALALVSRGTRRVALALLVVAMTVIVILAQSRSGMFGLAAALLVVLWLNAGTRWTVVAIGGVAATLLGTGGWAIVWSYVRRGQAMEQFIRGTGRTGIWADTWTAAQTSPILGHGFHADRLILEQHVHDAWLHSLIQAGFVGLLLFAAAWLWTWRNAFTAGLLGRFREVDGPERSRRVIATGILVFLTLRSIPESTAAFYGVDLLITAPLFAYFHTVARSRPTPAASSSSHRILACAYACGPPGSPSMDGGEALLGWRLVHEAARRQETWVLASDTHRVDIEDALATNPHPNLHFTYVDLPGWMHRFRQHQGGVQLYAYLWQVKAHLVAESLHEDHPFTLFHHITYANDWMASHTGALLPVPYVRGPGGGAHHVPRTFHHWYGWRFRLAQWWRAGMQNILRADPLFRVGQDRASRILLCNHEALQTLPRRWREKAELFPVNGIDSGEVPVQAKLKPNGRPFTVVTVGKLIPIKGTDLAVEAFCRFRRRVDDARLVVVGDGPEREGLEAQVRSLGFGNCVEFTGWLPHDKALWHMAEADVLLFPSLRDGGGAVVVEAMACGTPVICFDLHGPGLHVTPECGIKVPAIDPDQAVRDFSNALDDLSRDQALRVRLAFGARERALEHYEWGRLGDRLQEIYRGVPDRPRAVPETAPPAPGVPAR